MFVAAAPLARGQFTFTNPIASNGADPWVQLINGTYYYTDTTGGNVSVAASTTLPGIGTAPMTNVYNPPAGAGNVWAPELHQINGTWYAYYSMTTSTSDHRMYVLQANTSNPQGSYTYKGEINDPTNLWAIDGTVLTAANGNLYFVWSGWAGTTNVAQNLYIAPMSNPWTISGNRVLLSTPSNSWEQQGGPPTINEGPEVLKSAGGTTSIIYSASGSWTNNYCLGQLTLTGTDPLNPASWTKNNAGPVFSSANGVFGPGHASFTTSDNGTRDWIVYHAAKTSGSGWDRNIRTQPFSWNPDGTPSFGQPVPVTVPIQWGPTNWVGAINLANNDTVHSYLNSANWVNGTINDSFANVTLTDNTTLFFNANRSTPGDMIFTYGSGQKSLSLVSDSATARTLALNGNVTVNILGGSNSVYFGSATKPLAIAMGSSQVSFNIASDDTVFVDSGLTGTAGLNVTGGGTLTLRGTKTYTGLTTISNGTLAAGDGSAASGTTNLPVNAVVSIASAGTLQLNGVGTSTANVETIAALTGTGAITAPTNTVTLNLTETSPATFAGNISGAKLSFVQAGTSTQTLSGANSYGGNTVTATGTLNVTGSITGTGNLFINKGTTTVAATGSITTTNFVSIGQAAGDNSTMNVSGAFTVPSDLNVGDVSATGLLNIFPGATVATRALSVGKYVTANGTVVQTGGAVTALAGGGDWRIGGAGSASDAAAVGVYNLSGGSINTGVYNLQIGAYGTGTLTQSGGSVTSGGFLSIGRFTGAVGNYNISGGTLTATAQPYAIVGEQGTGTLRVSSTGSVNTTLLSIGHNGGTGTVIQTGGAVAATTAVLLGQAAGGSGTYLLSGGTLTTSYVSRGAGTGVFDFDGGTLIPTASRTNFVQGLTTAAVRAGGAVFSTNGFNVTVNQPLVHDSSIPGVDGGLTKLGAGTLTIGGLESYTGNTSVNGGVLAFTPNTATSILVRPVGAVSVAAGASLIAGATTVTPGSTTARSLLVASNSVSAAGVLDLGINDLQVKNGSLDAITQLVTNGYNGPSGNWTGNGITSSTAAASTSHLTALGVIQNGNIYGSAGSLGLFDGISPSPADVLVKYTYVGDSNLDGIVDGSDYTLIDSGYASNVTGWLNGDYNYDSHIDGSDYTLIDNAFNTQGNSLSTTASAVLGSALIADSTTQLAGTVAVPEPTTGLVVLAVGSLLARRRRVALTPTHQA